MTAALKMMTGAERGLTAGEREALSPGLLAALEAHGAKPTIVARASVLAWIAGFWRANTPVLTLRNRIFWPGALTDFSLGGCDHELGVLQHELQHVLDYADGSLTLRGYACRPSNWRYGYELKPDSVWQDFGAEQRACLAEDHWRRTRTSLPSSGLEGVIPWLAAAPPVEGSEPLAENLSADASNRPAIASES